MKKPPVRPSDEEPASAHGKEPLGAPSRIPQPWAGKNVSGGNAMEYKNDEHNRHMESAAKHSTYHGHDGKANAPLPFGGAGPGTMAEEDVDEPTRGQETMPKPFLTGKSATAGRGANPKQPKTRD